MNTKEYRLPLNGTASSNLRAISEIIETNSGIFDNYLLSRYGDDSRYTVVDGSFEVTDIGEDIFSFTAEIEYYAGCPDINFEDTVNDQLEYEIIDSDIVINLDETSWEVR